MIYTDYADKTCSANYSPDMPQPLMPYRDALEKSGCAIDDDYSSEMT